MHFFPNYIQILKLTKKGWLKPSSKIFFNPNNIQVDSANPGKAYGLSNEQIIAELVLRFNSTLGNYIVNLDTKKYYYCGTEDIDIQKKLWELGITKPEPIEETK